MYIFSNLSDNGRATGFHFFLSQNVSIMLSKIITLKLGSTKLQNTEAIYFADTFLYNAL